MLLFMSDNRSSRYIYW